MGMAHRQEPGLIPRFAPRSLRQKHITAQAKNTVIKSTKDKLSIGNAPVAREWSGP
jgi:hypothetical protein